MSFKQHDTVTVSFRDTTRQAEAYHDVTSFFADDGILAIYTHNAEYGIPIDLIDRYVARGGHS